MKGDKDRAKLVAGGYEDESKIKKILTIGETTMPVIFAIAASEGWKVKTTDIKSAFLQGKVPEREVSLTPPREAGLSKAKIWKLVCCLYGLWSKQCRQTIL